MHSQVKQAELHTQKPLQQPADALKVDRLKDREQVHVFGVLEESCHLLYS